MVNEQLSIFEADTQQPAPRCRMCVRPARWLNTQAQWAMYCAGKACSNRDRMCQACNKAFVMNVDGAGSKYCSTECKVAGYHPTTVAGTGLVQCTWCGQQKPKPGMGPRHENRVWPYICAECTAPIKHVVHRLKEHHVPHHRARRLLDDPRCEICHRDILTRVRINDASKPRALLVVDHDHACCPGQHSCGKCVRGLICTHCNLALGLLDDDPNVMRSAAEYVIRFFPNRT